MTKKKRENIFLKMHPVHRVLTSLGFVTVAFLLLLRTDIKLLVQLMILWNVFSISYIASSWVVFLTRQHTEIRELAQEEDGSRWFVLSFILVCAMASLANVFLLLIAGKSQTGSDLLSVIVAFTGMLSSWFMVHTIFSFHYANLYYNEQVEGGLEFPKETNPDYLDFAYFSFVIGMTFQVSDVEISSREIRRLTLLHSLLAFGLNTFVVALTINMIAGLEI